MKKEFIPYQQALELKELGFDEDVFEWFDTETKDFCDVMKEVKAPLYQQAFRFLRNKYNLMPLVDRSYMNLYEFRVVEKGWGYTASTYEEAELACLKKLIEVAKKIKENDDLTSSDIVGY